MTAVEKRFWRAILQTAGMPVDTVPDLDVLGYVIRRTAYHEAGHAAVLGAMGEAHLMVVRRISVLPEDAGTDGFLERQHFGDPEATAENHGWFMGEVVYYLAGTVAARRALGEDHGPGAVFREMGDELHGARSQGGVMCDGAWALHYAEQIVRRGWPRRRVLRTACLWAVEILAIPEVWQAVEACAARLLDRGEVRRRRELDRLFGGLDGVLEREPRRWTWRRRLPCVFAAF